MIVLKNTALNRSLAGLVLESVNTTMSSSRLSAADGSVEQHGMENVKGAEQNLYKKQAEQCGKFKFQSHARIPRLLMPVVDRPVEAGSARRFVRGICFQGALLASIDRP